jgi:hypothetical protein
LTGTVAGVVRFISCICRTGEEVFMNSDNIIETTQRPGACSKGAGEMWLDAYISDRMGRRKEVIMELHKIIEATKRPEVYSKGTAKM